MKRGSQVDNANGINGSKEKRGVRSLTSALSSHPKAGSGVPAQQVPLSGGTRRHAASTCPGRTLYSLAACFLLCKQITVFLRRLLRAEVAHVAFGPPTASSAPPTRPSQRPSLLPGGRAALGPAWTTCCRPTFGTQPQKQSASLYRSIGGNKVLSQVPASNLRPSGIFLILKPGHLTRERECLCFANLTHKNKPHFCG